MTDGEVARFETVVAEAFASGPEKIARKSEYFERNGRGVEPPGRISRDRADIRPFFGIPGRSSEESRLVSAHGRRAGHGCPEWFVLL